MAKYEIQCIHIRGLKFNAKDDEEANEKADEMMEDLNETLYEKGIIGARDNVKVDDYEVEEVE
ncbi:hypothetical protein M0R04_06615 [Candidatus Dojkabacteria bacterium]|jgi:ArsR family metal-binding transcriptional regulator|nr:hypothetical protein [Candidatus Dojkabacteria bacterium]